MATVTVIQILQRSARDDGARARDAMPRDDVAFDDDDARPRDAKTFWDAAFARSAPERMTPTHRHRDGTTTTGRDATGDDEGAAHDAADTSFARGAFAGGRTRDVGSSEELTLMTRLRLAARQPDATTTTTTSARRKPGSSVASGQNTRVDAWLEQSLRANLAQENDSSTSSAYGGRMARSGAGSYARGDDETGMPVIVGVDRGGYQYQQHQNHHRGRPPVSLHSPRSSGASLLQHRRKDSLGQLDSFSVDMESDRADVTESSFLESATTILDRPRQYVDDAEMGVDHLAHKELLWKLSSTYLPNDVASLQRSLVRHVEYTLARRRYKLDTSSFYQATAHSVRDRLIERWTDTQQYSAKKGAKKVYYLSLEFLIGRSLGNAVSNLGLRGAYAEALRQIGYDLEDIMSEEKEPALGNGGLGRLASCFLDTLATQNYPAWGYGIRYKYGMFEQRIVNGKQVEFPDYWLTDGNPWEVERLDVQYPVRLFGHVREFQDPDGNTLYAWEGGEVVMAQAYDTPIPGYGTYNTNNMRLWSSKPSHEFNLASFNAGNYYGAVEAKERCESITSVLYPNDATEEGKRLRLKQQYFFVSATLQDIYRRFKKNVGRGSTTMKNMPDKVAIQLNDTHPAIAIPELMRLLLDIERLPWDEAWEITRKVFAYTNHTILPEALEKWPVPMITELLPRHMQIIYEINHRFLLEVQKMWPNDTARMSSMSIIEESSPKMVRMSNLAVIGSHTVNGVAMIHTKLLKSLLFPDFLLMWPEKFINVTNGVTPRRWLLQANPALASIYTGMVGPGWVNDLKRLEPIKTMAQDPQFRQRWRAAKQTNKQALAEWLYRSMNIRVDPNALFDMQIKRIHEYKRQLLNVLGIVHRYAEITQATPEQRKTMVPRVHIIAGKAAPGYVMAKNLVMLVCAVSEVVNSDAACRDLLKVVFVPNFNVSLAEILIPASDISQHISTAGMEASGTGNMKFVMNGGLIVGTMDGANIEIEQAIGEHNMFTFGAKADQVAAIRRKMAHDPPKIDPRLHRAMGMIRAGIFGKPDDGAYNQLLDAIDPRKDVYLTAHDFPSYLGAIAEADAAYQYEEKWTAKCIEAACSMWMFSSDRTIREYAAKIWNVEPLPFRPPRHHSER